jgi:hypothetical protein
LVKIKITSQICIVNNVTYGHKPTVAVPDRTGKKCSSLTSRGFVSPGVMVRFALIVKGMSVTPRPVLWSGVDLEVERGGVSHTILTPGARTEQLGVA